MSLALNNFNNFVQDLSNSVIGTDEIKETRELNKAPKVTNLFKGFDTKTKKSSKTKLKKDVFTSSIEIIYCNQPTEKLERIFEEKKETYHTQTAFYQDTTVRYKELEILRVLRKELSKREVFVEIFN